jgi:simple sugar transport system permease protein
VIAALDLAAALLADPALWVAALGLASPLLLAALGELVMERAGVLNIGLEGVMLAGAFAAFAAAVATGSPALGVASAAATGAAVGALFAAFAVLRGSDAIVTGTAVNLLALGATGVAYRSLYAGATPTSATVSQTPFVWAGLVTAAILAFFLARTRPGLRLRAAGEAARAADAEGVAVPRVRTLAVIAGSALAGAAGAALPLALANTFSENMTAGRGFIALTIVIFGRWRPDGVVLGALFFGLATAVQFRLQARGLDLPYPAFLMLPYVLTLLVLALAAGRGRAPAELGRPYRREGR